MKKIIKTISFIIPLIVVAIFIIFIHHHIYYKNISYYFFSPLKEKLVIESLETKWNVKDKNSAIKSLFYQYEKGPLDYTLKNIFKHGNTTTQFYFYQDMLIIDFHQNTITRLNNKEEKWLIKGITETLKLHKKTNASPMYPYLKETKYLFFTFGGYPFQYISGVYDYNKKISIE